MPIICVVMWFAPLLAAVPFAMSESAKEKKVNELCIEKFKTPQEIKECKTILMKINPSDLKH